MTRIQLLGIPIDAVTSNKVIEQVQKMLSSGSQNHVMTPNSEMLVESVKNPEFRSVLQKSELNIPDSVGLLWAARWTGQVLPERVTGVDVVVSLCKQLESESSVFLLGGTSGVGLRTSEKLKEWNPALKIAGVYEGSPDNSDAEEIIRRVNESGARLLLVAYGAPKQDMWIHKHLSAMTSVRVAMGVGGTLDFIAGKRKRAPQWMQSMGLEWLWRLMREPKRIGRILKAIIVFPYYVVRYGK